MPPSPPPGYPGAAPYGQMPPPPKKSSTAPIVVILIVACVGGLFVLGIIAAIAIPAFLRARMSANEASAVAAMRTMASAQVAWLSAHDGQPALPSCLGEPASCGDPQASRFLDPEMASLQEILPDSEWTIPQRGTAARWRDLADENARHLLESLRIESFETEERAEDPVYALPCSSMSTAWRGCSRARRCW